MTKSKDFVKIRPILFPLTAIAMLAGCLVVEAQSAASQFDVRILPSLEKLVSAEDLDHIQGQLNSLEKKVLKDSRQNKNRYCEALFNFVVFRYKLNRRSASLMDPSGSDSEALKKEFEEVVEKNVFRAEELFAKGKKECSFAGKPSEAYLMARFVNASLFDNVSSSFGLTASFESNRAIKAKRAEQVLFDYDFVLTEFRSLEDKSWIDPVLLLYSFANALVRQGQFETAEPLLSECVTIASQKYGKDSPLLLPILRLSAAIAACAGDQAGRQQYIAWISSINHGSDDGEETFLDLRSRATLISKTAFSWDSFITVSGPREEIERNQKRLPKLRDTTADLPFPAGQGSLVNQSLGARGVRFPMEVFITVNESGDVTNAEVWDLPEKVRARLKEIALGLKFMPLTYKGRVTSMKGFVKIYVKYVYNN